MNHNPNSKRLTYGDGMVIVDSTAYVVDARHVAVRNAIELARAGERPPLHVPA